MQAHKIIARAYEFIGTPYIENCAIKNVGCDCLGLIAAVFGIDEDLRQLGFDGAIEKYFKTCKPNPSKVLAFRVNDNFHFGIMVENKQFIHAHWSQGIVKNTFGNWFRARFIGAYEKKDL